jgi:hypothetical protein
LVCSDKFGLTAAQLEKLALGATEKIFGKADTQSFDFLRLFYGQLC